MSDPSQQASGSGAVPPPPATPMTLETMGHAIQSLMQAMNVMVTTVNTLTTTVNVASSIRPCATKVAVSKPKVLRFSLGLARTAYLPVMTTARTASLVMDYYLVAYITCMIVTHS